MLTSAREQYATQQRLTELAIAEAARRSVRGSRAVAAVIATYQLESAANAFEHGPAILAEQGIEAPSVATASLTSVLTGAAAIPLLEQLANDDARDRLVRTLVNDAGRTASTIDMARRPKVTAWIRSLTPPSCARCAILAGRVYRRTSWFQRHPNCDCLMTPTTVEIGPQLVTDPDEAVRNGWVHGLSKADLAALDEGANLNRLVNIRKQAASLKVGSSVMKRGNTLTPAGIMHAAGDDRDMALRLMHQNGYIYRPEISQ